MGLAGELPVEMLPGNVAWLKKKKRRHLFSCLSLSRISVTQNIGEQADVWPPWKAWGRALLGTLALLRPAVPSWNLLAASPGL